MIAKPNPTIIGGMNLRMKRINTNYIISIN